MNRLEIEVYSDFVCPWCFIGSRGLEAALQSVGETQILALVASSVQRLPNDSSWCQRPRRVKSR